MYDGADTTGCRLKRLTGDDDTSSRYGGPDLSATVSRASHMFLHFHSDYSVVRFRMNTQPAVVCYF